MFFFLMLIDIYSATKTNNGWIFPDFTVLINVT